MALRSLFARLQINPIQRNIFRHLTTQNTNVFNAEDFAITRGLVTGYFFCNLFVVFMIFPSMNETPKLKKKYEYDHEEVCIHDSFIDTKN